MNEAFEDCRREANLPEVRKLVGSSTLDSFGYFQSYVLLNDLNYRGAPVFQSYVAGDARFTQINEKFYLSPEAPEYVLFCLAPVDRKFAPLEDPRVLQLLVLNYDCVARERFFILLKRARVGSPQLDLLQQGTVRPNEPIDLTRYPERNLWLEIQVKPSLLGRLREWLFRPGTVRLSAWRELGQGLLHRSRAPPASLAAGFIASPLLTRTEDVARVCTDQASVRPGAYKVELPPGEASFWNSLVQFRVYEIQKPKSGSAATKPEPNAQN